jgi:hypothetical protein
MEPINQNQKPQPTKSNQSNSVPIRVHKDIARLIRRDLTKLNKKDFGRRISFSDFVAKAISKVTDDDRKELQEASLSNADRLELLYRSHTEKGSKLSKDLFLGKVLAATIGATNGGTYE